MRVAQFLRLERLLQKLSFSSYRFIDYFPGFETNKIVQRIFGKDTEEILLGLRVEFTWIGGYMWVNSSNGHLIINSRYLRNGKRIYIYLDLIHELVHIRQLRDGKDLFDGAYSYVDRPTEVEAYYYAVEEAKRLQLREQTICDYLKTEWMNLRDFHRLAHTLNVRCNI
jgi:hypothetical protein